MNLQFRFPEDPYATALPIPIQEHALLGQLQDLPILSFPNEILLQVADHLEQKDICSLLQVNHRFYALLADYALLHNIRHRGASALAWAAKTGCIAIVPKLVQLGADINRPVKGPNAWFPGQTVLSIAASYGNLAMTRLLLDLGANVMQRDSRGLAPLHFAIDPTKKGIIAEFCARIPNLHRYIVNLPMNRTPLHDVALDGLVTFIFRFVEIGMDISATDTNGRTPLDEAKEGLRSGNWHHILSETENDKEALVSSALVALGEERSKANRFTAAAVRVQRWFLGEKLEHNLYGILEELYDKEWPRKNPSALVFAARFRMSKLHEDRRK